MSYILEALKKAEHDREIGQVPRIDSEHEPAATRLSSRWAALVVLVLLINAGLLLALFWPDSAKEVVKPAVVQRDYASLTVESMPGVSDKSMSPDHQPVAVERAVPVTPPPLPVREPAADTPVPQVTAVPSQPVSTPVRESPPPSENLPVWPQVPDYIFQKLSRGLRLDVHVYSKRPEERFVLINLQKYREGEQLQEGPVVDAITPDGIVLSLQGQKFLVQAQ
jgi:general secretion pathway protein B